LKYEERHEEGDEDEDEEQCLSNAKRGASTSFHHINHNIGVDVMDVIRWCRPGQALEMALDTS